MKIVFISLYALIIVIGSTVSSIFEGWNNYLFGFIMGCLAVEVLNMALENNNE